MPGFGNIEDNGVNPFGAEPDLSQEIDLEALGRGSRKGGNLGGGFGGEEEAEKGKDCYELFFAIVPIVWIPIKGKGGKIGKGGKGVKSWSVQIPGRTDTGFVAGPGLSTWITYLTPFGWAGDVGWREIDPDGFERPSDPHIAKICLCLSYWGMQGLARTMRTPQGAGCKGCPVISLNNGKWKDSSTPANALRPAANVETYMFASAKLSCEDHRGGVWGILVKKKCGEGSKCLCEDSKSLTLKGLTEKTKEYTCSDGSKITVGPSTDFKKVIEKIVEAERKCMKVDCAGPRGMPVIAPPNRIN